MTARSVLLDSSVWIEILGSGPLLAACQREARAATEIIVPTLVVFEVYRKVRVTISEDHALSAIATLVQNSVVELTQEVALTGADISLEQGLGMADSLVLAHARATGAILVTLDSDFAGIAGVKVLRKG